MRKANYQVTVNSTPTVAYFVKADDPGLAISKVMAGDYDRLETGVSYPLEDAAPDELIVLMV
jgi:hypothetical protein